jgi:hypothetical protein
MAKKSKVAAIPNVVPSCKIKIIDDSGAVPMWKTLDQTLYTPKAIADSIRKNKIQWAWVFTSFGREVWEIKGKSTLATQKR